MALEKTYISANQLLIDAYELGLKVLDSGFRPDFIVGVWRGGAPVGIAIHELFEYAGYPTDHIAVRTSLYTGINRTAGEVQVYGLGYLVERISNGSRVLIVDDVFDSGRSVQELVLELQRRCAPAEPVLRVATPYFKPARNETDRVPDYYLHARDEWLVFPHELEGLTARELEQDKPGLGHLRERIVALRGSLSD